MQTPNLHLNLFTPLGVGWREDATAGLLLDENMALIDAALGHAGSSVSVNSASVANPNFVNSATVTFSVTGSSVSATATVVGGAYLPLAGGTMSGNINLNENLLVWENPSLGIDTGLSRGAAGAVYVGNGTAGDYSGSLKLTNLTLTSSIVLGDFASLPAFLTSGGQSEGYPSVNYVSVVIPNGVEHNSVSAGTLFNTYCADPNIYAIGLNSSCLSTIGAYGIYSQAMLASGASFGTATAFSGDVYLEDSTINNSYNFGMGFGMWPHGGANNYFVGSIIYIGLPETSPYTTDLTGTVWANCYEANAAFSDPATGTSIGFYIDPETSGSGIQGATRYALKFDTTAQSAFNGVIGWQNTGLTALDTGISRLGAASLAMGNGTNGDYSGSLTLANLILSATQSPASNAAGTAGQLAYDGSFIYVCISSGVWKRAALTGGY